MLGLPCPAWGIPGCLTGRLWWLQTTLGAQTQNRDEPQMPVLEGGDIAQNSFLLAACALRTPHVHPNANGLLYVVNGEGMKHRALAVQLVKPRSTCRG